MKNFYSKWLLDHKIDLIVWSLFLLYEITVVGLISKSFGSPITYLLHYAINISVFYLHALWLFPWALREKRNALWRIPAVILFEIVLYMLLAYWGDVWLIHMKIITHLTELQFTHQFALTCIYRCIYFLGFATGYYFILDHLREKKKVNEMEKQSLLKQHAIETELVKTQNEFLKAQINPHFLFNTLDFVYHTIERDTNKATEAVILLSRMMRYAIKPYEDREYIFLEEEIAQVENLIYLHQLRKSNALYIQLTAQQDVGKVKFIPLVLLTLVENMFKHGDLTEVGHEALINLEVDEAYFYLRTDNLIDRRAGLKGSRIGLQNIQKRLLHTYGEHFSFTWYEDDGKHFKVEIRIPLLSLTVHEVPLNDERENDKLPFHATADLRQIID